MPLSHEQLMDLQILKIYRAHYAEVDPDSEDGRLILEVITKHVRAVLN